MGVRRRSVVFNIINRIDIYRQDVSGRNKQLLAKYMI
jgi:hypothetical protein